MTHFLDAQGNIPRLIPNEGTQLASFHALVVDETTKLLPARLTTIDLRCFEKGCEGMVRVELLPSNKIHWICSRCENEGMISHWQGTKWDNRKEKMPL